MVFIYKKEDRIKVLTTTESSERHQQLLEVGWEHTSTLDPCRFLEYLHNAKKKEIIKLIKEL